MQTLLAPIPSAKSTVLTIKGYDYQVEAIDPHEEGTVAFRLDKLRGDGIYDVVLTHDGLVVCDCPSYVMTYQGTSSPCKHGKALIEAGLIKRPVVAEPVKAEVTPIPPTFQEVTDLDRKRAAMWGLKLPAPIPVAPCFVAPEAPAPVVPEGWGEVGGGGSVEDIEEGPAWTWDAWVDEFTWELGPEAVEAPNLPADTESKTGSTSSWLAESTTEFLTRIALNYIEDGEPAEALALYDNTEPEFQRAFDEFLANSGSPATCWLSWLNIVQAGCPVSFPKPAPAPSKPTRLPRFVPTQDDDAEWSGFNLGYEGFAASAPSGWDSRRRAAFDQGYAAGVALLRKETLAYEEWLDQAYAALPDREYSEVVECCGVDVARRLAS